MLTMRLVLMVSRAPIVSVWYPDATGSMTGPGRSGSRQRGWDASLARTRDARPWPARRSGSAEHSAIDMITAPSTVATIVVANSSAASGVDARIRPAPKPGDHLHPSGEGGTGRIGGLSALLSAQSRRDDRTTRGEPLASGCRPSDRRRSHHLRWIRVGHIASTAEMVIPEAFSVAAAISSGLAGRKLR